MSPNQPLPATPAASPTPPPARDADRLLRLWCHLARRVARAAAHHDPAEQALLRLQLQVEQAIHDRHPDLSGQMNQLLAWESTLLHTGTGPAESCLTCRRAQQGIPGDLPFSASAGGAR